MLKIQEEALKMADILEKKEFVDESVLLNVASILRNLAFSSEHFDGWLYEDKDNQTQWSENHPVEHESISELRDIRAATVESLLEELKRSWESSKKIEAEDMTAMRSMIAKGLPTSLEALQKEKEAFVEEYVGSLKEGDVLGNLILIERDGSVHAGDLSMHEDVMKSASIVLSAYDWFVTDEGYLAGLVSGDMGYALTHIKISNLLT